jgi:hypothetical protein
VGGSLSYVFAKFQSEVPEKGYSQFTIPTYLTLFIFGFIYQFILVFDALRLKNTIQIIGLCICNLGFLIYAAVQMNQIRDAVLGLKDHRQPTASKSQAAAKFWRDTKPFLTAIPCVIAVGSICMSFVAWKLYNEFAWTIYKNISADLRLKRRYLAYQVRSTKGIFG